jgi:hypothetical protein
MAVIDAVLIESGSNYDHFNLSTWTLGAGDSGKAVQLAMSGDRSIQVSGAVTIEGSNDGVAFFTLNDVSGAPLVFAGAGLEQILEITRWIRPGVAAAGATVTLLAKRQA